MLDRRVRPRVALSRSAQRTASTPTGTLWNAFPHPPARDKVPREPAGKLADAELHFTRSDLDGLKLINFIGFAIRKRRRGTGRNVTFPARQYSVNGEWRTCSLLRSILDAVAQDRRSGHGVGCLRAGEASLSPGGIK